MKPLGISAVLNVIIFRNTPTCIFEDLIVDGNEKRGFGSTTIQSQSHTTSFDLKLDRRSRINCSKLNFFLGKSKNCRTYH